MGLDTKNMSYTFLLCSERSGSNFISKLMNNHSKVCGPSTKHIINPLARNYFRYQPLTEIGNWDILLKDILNLFNVNFSVWKSNFSIEEIKKNVSKGNLSELINYFFFKEACANNKKQLFIKEIKTYEFYPFLKCYYPNAKYVYQVRDPRDMALSWKKSNSHKGGVVAAARQWKHDQQQYLKINSLEDVQGNIVIVKYEDLVSQTKETLLPILNTIGIEYESEMIDMGKDELTNKNASQQIAWENLSKPIIKDNFNKYKKSLSEKEIQYIEAICFYEMKQLGYELENSKDILNGINESELKDFNISELKSLNYSPAIGIVENMQAKKRFYEHINEF